ncbi:dTDP-4-dehydrorhamnose reductase [Cnuella takakiae]|uniref:dTDP-4-dehydrorhamnose reductase n=1 Tax=Cnuella takakiae TaxID=1302690 RepID=A0A1M5A5T8_9BACT|nr:dTDP-4-dehydrorhamnose reductase [Cnuella takakiae]OLY92098.1 dTDP-4-dehydrorhamnose reductase [Cnuella takakiae]SHF25192.1 dTDP-4-dehydrorhamnose reductase [Cnuella takakiae]
MKILITGGAGQLGQAFQQLAAAHPHHQFIFTDRTELDITDEGAVDKMLRETGVEALVNCAAYTAVDKAETDVELAYAINATAAGVLARACAATGVQLVHVSTDYVFNGAGKEPYRENDPVSPVSVYGASKQMGEAEVLEANKDAVIIRTSWVYAPFANNFVKTMLRLMQSRPEIGVVADQFGSPTNALDLAAAILQVLDSGTRQGGIFHFSNEGVISWYDFALAIRDLSGLDCQVKPLTTAEYPTPAKRPAYSVMDKTKIQEVYGIRLKPWKESLAACLEQLATVKA